MSDPWRYRCPNGHTNWTSRNDQYRCKTCKIDFDELVDMKRECRA